jgi:hypothetical protein
MIRKGLLSALVIALLGGGAAPAAAQFMAADLIYLPAVTHTNGAGSSQWRSDLFITNVEEDVSIDVALAYLPTGLISNGAVFSDRSTWLGGREDDGFGFVNTELANIPPGGTVVLQDPVGEYWSTLDNVANTGAVALFAYQANTLEDDGSREHKRAIVNTRAYTPFTFYLPDSENEGEFVEWTGTFGQTLPGIAWYNLADPSAVGDNGDFSFLLLTGAGETDDFRYNVGLINASDPLTQITITIQPFQGDGEPFTDNEGFELLRTLIMPPASHIQYESIYTTLFGLEDVPPDAHLKISVVQWSSGAAQPVVGLTTYGTLIDNVTQDPTAILPLFGHPYNVECQWPSTDAKSAGSGSYPRVTRRPVEIPSR